jgi:AbrB family looped-hinge helix DNA binding protein
MKVGERGQVTIPKDLRERFGIEPGTPVEFEAVEGRLVLRKVPRKLNLRKWRGRCAETFAELGNPTVDDIIEDMRGR